MVDHDSQRPSVVLVCTVAITALVTGNRQLLAVVRCQRGILPPAASGTCCTAAQAAGSGCTILEAAYAMQCLPVWLAQFASVTGKGRPQTSVGRDASGSRTALPCLQLCAAWQLQDGHVV